MKIGFVLNDYYPFGGLQEDCLATALATQSRGHEVHIFTRSWKGESPSEIHTHLLGKKGWTNIARNQYFFNQLAIELPRHQLDGVVSFSRIPRSDIYFAADPCFVERKKHLAFWQKWSARYRFYAGLEADVFEQKNPPHTLVLTEREIDSFHRHYGTPKDRFHWLPPGVERNTTSAAEQARNRAEVRSELDASQTATIALFVGSGFRIKGLDRALKAIRANKDSAKDLEFWIVGNGKPARFQSLADNAGVTVRFLGGRADVNRFYDAADFLLHPAYSESAGKILLEALTHGLPVLTTDTCGYGPHIEKAQAGLVLSSPFSQEACNTALKRFIQDTEARKAWSDHARRYAKNEDLYSCHEAAAKLIEQLVATGDTVAEI